MDCNNKFGTEFQFSKDDLVNWIKEVLPDPFCYREESGASYNKDIRELEYFSRPLWAIFSLMVNDNFKYSEIIEPYMKRIKMGLHKNTLYSFPYPTTKTRQIAVEMAVYGYGLLACKKTFLQYLSKEEIRELENWLNTINKIEIPIGNWLFFLLIVNYGLKENNLNYDQSKIDFALENIEKLYIGNGWYKDGCDGQRDYYIAFAFHFYSQILKKYCKAFPINVEERSSLFEQEFLYWFDKNGISLPFGRSLTYRFAHVSYWASSVVSNIYQVDLSYIKSLIHKNLNFWFSKDKLFTIGYGYSNLLLSEDYNATGSPMWSMKTMVILSLPDNHDFWKIEEKNINFLDDMYVSQKSGLLFVTGNFHHYALSANQYSKNKILQHMSKYGKFCYSTAFGWNLSRDVEGIENFAVDNALAISINGTNQYQSRGYIYNSKVCDEYIYSQWNYGEIAMIDTWLIPVNEQCHVRIHRIRSAFELETYEGAFPVWSWNRKFDDFKKINNGIELEKLGKISAIVDLLGNRKSSVIAQNPNTNIYSWEKNAIASLHGYITNGIYACAVYCSINQQIEYQYIKLINNEIFLNDKKIKLMEL